MQMVALSVCIARRFHANFNETEGNGYFSQAADRRS
jgi:hypothetical protein